MYLPNILPPPQTPANLGYSAYICPGEYLNLPLCHIRKNTQITVCAKGRNMKFIFGRGKNTFQGYSVEIGKDSLHLFQYLSAQKNIGNYAHTLGKSTTITAVVDYSDGANASLTLIGDCGQLFSADVNWWAGGGVYLQNLGEEYLQATIIFHVKDTGCPVWFFGDSYFNWRDSARWPYYIYQEGYTNWLADHQPGEASGEAIKCLEYDLKLGTPKYAVWCLGMNDPSDADGPNASWLSAINRFLELCAEKNITPILATIPSVPERNHKGKAQWVRNSGYRYIDFAEAVEAADNGLWQEGMLSADGVHPSQLGAKAMAAQVLKDFPEIAITKKNIK